MNRRGFIVSTGPVNRRTRQPSRQTASGEPVRERIRAVRTRLGLGLPLARQLARSPRGSAGLPQAAALLIVMISLLLMLPGTLHPVGWLFAAGASAIVAGGLMVRGGCASSVCAEPLAWIDDVVLRAFDRLLEASAAEIEPEHLERLGEIKAAVVGIARIEADTNAQLAPDDRHFVIESLRRYLPDSLAAYLAVPSAWRCDPRAPAPASALFGEQLRLLRDELRQCEERAAAQATEGLLRQQRFLAGKRGSRRASGTCAGQ